MEIEQKEKFLRILFKPPIFTVSNLLCIIRLSLLPFVFHFLMTYENMWALIIIGIGALTDLMDGFIARRYRQVSELGKFLDPLIDKGTVVAVLYFLTYRNFQDYSTYPLVLTFGTCFLTFVGLSYLFALPFVAKKSGAIPISNKPGKVTAVCSVVMVALYILEVHPWADVWMVITIGMNLTSGVIYFLRDLHQRNKAIRIGWANRITMLRVALSPLFLLVFFHDGDGNYDNNLFAFKILALLLIIALVVSDRIDGMLARKRGEISALGKLLDPFADKIALMTIFLCFIATGWASVWMVACIFYRESMVSFLRTLAANEQIILAAQPIGKAKTVIQSTIAITLLSLSFLRELADNTGLSVYLGTFFDVWDFTWTWLPWMLMLGVTIITGLSGIDYLKKNWKIIQAALKGG
jgi:CDP-diacylglycerol--glycerol-3-phosphate 3-phosphatidyltransferase